MEVESPKVYASLDIEAIGKSPYDGSMISLGVEFVDATTLKSLCSVIIDFEPQRWQSWDDALKNDFWVENKAELDAIRARAVDIELGMARLVNVVRSAGNNVEWVAYPAAYDWQWINYYVQRYVRREEDRALFGYTATCVDALEELYKEKSGDGKSVSVTPNTKAHNALADAQYQMRLFLALRAALLK